ncbi:extracellular matrix/biofilm biosynthesis regulator RemA family protein [Bacillus sp. REN3]|uniref:extracellular matrix regulator RemB n=1 Tax=Bacillus sp. REN3 TaxID=2802440 RepID=UPI001AED791F|nr:extracellular matrix/biofilm biosynthesis regulator RemA family protein [Bacillus sp. REN3]
MYLHVGEEVLVRTRDIIAILDIDSAKSSPFMEEFIGRQQKKAVHLAKGAAKSIVVTGDLVYFSPLASGTLKKRSMKSSVQEF